MLVLSRKVGESIELVDVDTGERITIMVTRVMAQGSVRLGIDAVKRWDIVRTELKDRDED